MVVISRRVTKRDPTYERRIRSASAGDMGQSGLVESSPRGVGVLSASCQTRILPVKSPTKTRLPSCEKTPRSGMSVKPSNLIELLPSAFQNRSVFTRPQVRIAPVGAD